MIMAFIFARMLVTLGAVLWAIVGGLIYSYIGDTHRATGLVIFCGFVAWIARPNAEECAEFETFRKQRAAKHGIDI